MIDSQSIQLLSATEADLPVVENLMSYYVYDYTDYVGWACPESGRFGGCDYVIEEWKTGKNYPYVIRVGGELAGFAMVGLPRIPTTPRLAGHVND